MAFQLAVGMVFHGHCNGYFGSGSFGDKRVEAFGVDWVVVRDDHGVSLGNFDDQNELLTLAEKWAAEPGG